MICITHSYVSVILFTQDNEPDGTLEGEDFDAVVGKADHQATSDRLCFCLSLTLTVSRTASSGHGFALEEQRHPAQKPPA